MIWYMMLNRMVPLAKSNLFGIMYKDFNKKDVEYGGKL